MVQGIGFSEREKKFVFKNKDTMFPGQIAKELSKFSESGGKRSREAVVRLIKRESAEESD